MTIKINARNKYDDNHMNITIIASFINKIAYCQHMYTSSLFFPKREFYYAAIFQQLNHRCSSYVFKEKCHMRIKEQKEQKNSAIFFAIHWFYDSKNIWVFWCASMFDTWSRIVWSPSAAIYFPSENRQIHMVNLLVLAYISCYKRRQIETKLNFFRSLIRSLICHLNIHCFKIYFAHLYLL